MWWAVLAGLFVASLAWRLTVLGRLAGGPMLTHLTADADSYWRWATEIRSGQWASQNPFFLGPLYAYWLAITRSIVGDAIIPVLVVQAVLGAGTVCLLTDASRRLANRVPAALIGVALTGYSVAVLMNCLVLMETVILLGEALLVWWIVREEATRGGRWTPAVIGALIGTLALGRATYLLLLIPCMPYLAMQRSRGEAVRRVLAMLAMIAVTATPAALSNARITGTWMPYTYSLGYNLYIGNGPEAHGSYVDVTAPFPWEALDAHGASGATGGDGRSFILRTRGVRLSPVESSRYWLRLTREEVGRHPFRAALGYLRKLALMLNRYELPQVGSLEAYRRSAGALGWPMDVEFAVFAVFGAIGIPLAIERSGASRAIAGMLIMLWAGTAIFFIVDRYRIHLLAFLAPLAAIGIDGLWQLRKGSDAGGWLTAGLSGAGAAVLLVLPLVPRDAAHDQWSAQMALGEAWLSEGKAREALPLLRQAVALDRAGRLSAYSALSQRSARAEAFEDLGIAQSQLDDPASALASYSDAVRLVPEAVSLRVPLADLHAELGEIQAARREYASAGIEPRRAAEHLLAEARRDDARGDQVGLVRHLKAAVGLDPKREDAVIPLVRLEIERGELAEASALLAEARRAGLEENVFLVHSAWIASVRGDTVHAQRLLDAIPHGAMRGDPRVVGTLELMRRAGQR